MTKSVARATRLDGDRPVSRDFSVAVRHTEARTERYAAQQEHTPIVESLSPP